MTRYFMPSHINYCETADGVVVLDMKRERYIGLERDCLSALKAFSDSTSGGTSPASCVQSPLAERLVQKGLLARRTRQTVDYRRQTTLTPDDSAADHVVPGLHTIRLHHLRNMVIASATAAYKLKCLSLWQTVATVQRRKASAQRDTVTSNASDIRELTGVFCALRPFLFSSRDACLLDSLALVEFLARYRHFPLWVFGVNTQPFGAHSWVQHDRLVLNGTAEQARAFVPIAAI